MKTPTVLALMTATAILSSVDSSSDSKEKTSSSSPEVGQVTEDEGSGLAARRSRVDEAADGRDERTISEWVNFLKDSGAEFIELAKHHLWLEPDEMVMTLDKSQVNQKALETLRNPYLQTLVGFYARLHEVNPNTQRTLISALTTHFGDDVMAAVLGEAKNSDDLAIKEIAMTLAEQQVQGWLTGRKSPGEVLTLLKLQEGYVSAKLEALIRFVMVYDTKNSSDVVLLDLLTSKFGKRELTSILAKAVTSDAPANAPALKLETQLFATWKMRPVNPEDVLHWLGINVYTVKNLTDPGLRQFFRYIDLLERTDSQLALEFVKTFVQHVENDFVARALVEARVTAKETGSTNKNVGKLEAYVFEWWIGDGESAYDVVKLLELGNYNIEKTFTARVEVLEDFIKALEEKKSTVVDLLSILSRAFNGQDKFIDFLGKNGLRSNTKALDFKAMLLKKWGDHQFSPKQVLEELKMTESVENLTGSRVAISMEYIETYPESGLSLGDMLRDNYKIEDLAKALVSIKKNGSLNKGVSELTTQLLTGWVNDGKKPEDVLKLLGLGGYKIDISKFDEQVGLLDDFIKVYNNVKSDNVKLITVMVSGDRGVSLLVTYLGIATQDVHHFGRSLKLVWIPKLEGLLLLEWKENHRPLEYVWEKLELFSDVDCVTSPSLRLMMEYIDMPQAEISKPKFWLVKTMLKNFTEEGLVEALREGASPYRQSKYLKRLKKELVAWWIKRGETTDHVFQSLKLNTMNLEGDYSTHVKLLEDFIVTFNAKTSTDVDLLTVMISGFGGVDKLELVFSKANGNYPDSGRFRELLEQLFTGWIALHLSPEEVALRLKMTETTKDLTGPKLRVYMMYIDKLDVKDPGHAFSLVSMCVKDLGDAAVAGALVEKLVVAEKIGLSNEDVEKLVKQLVEWWISSGKTADHVFSSLINPGELVYHGSFRKVADSFVDFGTKVEILDDFIHHKDMSPNVDLLTAMTSGFRGYDKLVLALAKARVFSIRQEKIEYLEEQLLARWIALRSDPEEVALRLKMIETTKDLTGPKLRVYMMYIDKLDVKDPGHAFSLVNMCVEDLGDAAVAGALVEKLVVAEKIGLSNEDVEKLVKQLVEWWISSGKTADHVFSSLKLDDMDSFVGFGVKVEILDDFIMGRNKKIKTNDDLLTVMTSGFRGCDKLVLALDEAKVDSVRKEKIVDLETKQLMMWKSPELKPEDVVRQLHMTTLEDLTGPKLRIYMMYINSTGKKGPGPVLLLIKMVVERFGYKAVAEALLNARAMAKEAGSPNEDVEKLILQWIRSNSIPDDVFAMLN